MGQEDRTPCSNNPARIAGPCDTLSINSLKRFCNNNGWWRKPFNKFCQKSCFEAGAGYDGDNCSPTGSPTTPPTATAAPATAAPTTATTTLATTTATAATTTSLLATT